MNRKESKTGKIAVFFSCGQLSDIISYQVFTFLIFTFYYSVIEINVVLITIGFIIWSIWNSLNDPILGFLSDRTHTKWGRRIPYIMIALIPLALIMVLLFTPPKSIGITDEISNFVYFFIIIIVFELFYTMYSLNLTSMFPETFISKEERIKGNNIRQVFTIFGLVIAFILPSLFISDYSDPQYLQQYQSFGIVIMIIIIIFGIIFLKFGPKEKPEFKDDYKNAPAFISSIKFCLKSKSFMWYIPAEIANWFVYGMLPTIVPLYGKYVLHIEDTLLISLLLGLTFISAAIFITFLWKPVVKRIGNRKAWMISMSIWILTLFPIMFINTFILGMIVFFLIGIGLSGSLYIIDLIVSDIIDEDEINTNMRREASYYGVNAFFLRLTTVLVFLAISSVFTSVGWTFFLPEKITPEIIFGLRSLMFIFPAIALGIGILSIYKYPLDGEKLSQLKSELQKIHDKKKSLL